jgi:tRNA pseudouridine38-40 synthase
MTTRYFLNISFKGTSYHGWQLQPNALTVQKILEDALSLVTGEEIRTTGAGRTDAGVHARSFFVHFDSTSESLRENRKFIFRLNSLLPHDISVNAVYRTLPDAHARFSAVSRTYCYHISLVKDPFTFDYHGTSGLFPI